MLRPEDTPVSRSDFRLHLVSLKRCTKVKYEYGVIQSSEAGGEKTPCGDDLAVASRQSILKQRPYSSRRNALRQDRPGSGPGKENMNPEDENKLGHKKAISCEQSSMRFSTGSSMMMRCESKSPPAMTLEPQVEPLYLLADQHRTLATAKIERRRRSPIASLIHLPYLHSLQSPKAAVQMQVRYGPEQSKDGIIPRHRAKAGQKKKWPCGKLASQSVSSLAAPLTPTPIPLPIVLYSSFEADKLRPRKLVYSWLDKLEPGIVSCQQRMIMTILEEYVRSLVSEEIHCPRCIKSLMYFPLPGTERFLKAWGSER